MKYLYRPSKVLPPSGASSSRPRVSLSWRSRIWNSNLFSFFLLILLILSFVKVTKEIILRYEINQEIKHLEAQLDSLSSKTEKMDKLIAYLKTDEYIEKQARTKLNLLKAGEKQINLVSGDKTDDAIVEADNMPNIIKWYNYFFQ